MITIEEEPEDEHNHSHDEQQQQQHIVVVGEEHNNCGSNHNNDATHTTTTTDDDNKNDAITTTANTKSQSFNKNYNDTTTTTTPTTTTTTTTVAEENNPAESSPKTQSPSSITSSSRHPDNKNTRSTSSSSLTSLTSLLTMEQKAHDAWTLKNDYDTAEDTYKTLLRRLRSSSSSSNTQRNDSSSSIKYKRLLLRVLTKSGDFYYQQKNHAVAYKHYCEVLDMTINSDDGKSLWETAAAAAGRDKIKNNDDDDDENFNDFIIRITFNTVKCCDARGKSAAKNGATDKALMHYKEGIELVVPYLKCDYKIIMDGDDDDDDDDGGEMRHALELMYLKQSKASGDLYVLMGDYREALRLLMGLFHVGVDADGNDGVDKNNNDATTTTDSFILCNNSDSQNEHDKNNNNNNNSKQYPNYLKCQRELATIYHNIGILHEKLSRYTAALHYYQKSLTIKRLHLPPGHEKTIKTLNCLGVIHFVRGDDDAALDYFKQILIHVKTKSNESNYRVYAATLQDMSAVHARRDEWHHAALCLEGTIRLMNKHAAASSSPHDKTIAEAYHKLGCIYHTMNDFEKAIECHLKSLRAKKVMSGGKARDNDYVAVSYRRLGSCHAAAGRLDEALECFQESLVAGNDVDRANVLNRMGMLYSQKGDAVRAIECYKRALHIPSLKRMRENNKSGSSSSVNLRVLLWNNLGNAHYAYATTLLSEKTNGGGGGGGGGRTAPVSSRRHHEEKALQCYRKAIDVANRSNLEFDETSIGAVYNLGILHLNRNAYDKASKCFGLSLRQDELLRSSATAASVVTSSSEAGMTRADLASAMTTAWNNIGNAHLKQGHYDMAVGFYEKSLEGKRAIINDNNNNHMMKNNNNNNNARGGNKKRDDEERLWGTMTNLGVAYMRSRRYDDALRCFESVLDSYREKDDDDQQQQQQKQEQQQLMMAKTGSSRRLEKTNSNNNVVVKDDYHFRIANIHNQIGNVKFRQGEYDSAMEHYQKSLDLKIAIRSSSSSQSQQQQQQQGNDNNNNDTTTTTIIDTPDILTTKHDMGLVLCKQRKFDEARRLFRDLYHKMTQTYGGNSVEVGKLLLDMAGVKCAVGHYQEATELCDEAEGIFKKGGVPRKGPYMRQLKYTLYKIKMKKIGNLM